MGERIGEKSRERWHSAALCLGFNEMTKLGKTLGEKVYWRMLREEAEKNFMSLGGKRIFKKDPAILELSLPDGMPFVRFRKDDIELMRATVAAHDKKKQHTAKRARP
jgi:hypothetical protein